MPSLEEGKSADDCTPYLLVSKLSDEPIGDIIRSSSRSGRCYGGWLPAISFLDGATIQPAMERKIYLTLLKNNVSARK